MQQDQVSAISGDYQGCRDNTGRFVSGHSGNPAGRPLGSKSLKTILVDELNKSTNDGTTLADELIRVMIQKAISEKDFKMIQLIWNQLEGLPNQRISVNNAEPPIPILHNIQN